MIDKGYISGSSRLLVLNLLQEKSCYGYELIKTLKKKYGTSIEDVIKYLEKSKQELDNILHSEEILLKLSKQKNDILNELYKNSILAKGKNYMYFIVSKDAKTIESEINTFYK